MIACACLGFKCTKRETQNTKRAGLVEQRAGSMRGAPSSSLFESSNRDQEGLVEQRAGLVEQRAPHVPSANLEEYDEGIKMYY